MILSIVILNFNTKDLLAKCLESIIKYPPICEYEVFVVDNASNDGSKEFVRSLKSPFVPIVSEENAGFSKGNNLALKKVTGEYVLLLNPDTEVLEGSFNKCILKMEQDSSIGILGCKVLLPNGKLDLACRRGFPNLQNSVFKFSGLAKLFSKNKLFAGYNLTYLDENKSYEVDSVVGAYMMMRQTVMKKIGLLDEDFFMYGEDIDWCYRTKQAGYRVFYFSEATIIHHKRASSKQSAKALIEFYRAMEIFYNKHYAKSHSKFVNVLVINSIRLLAKVKIMRNKMIR